MHEIMTPEQVALYLQMTTDTIYRLIRSHRLPAARIGRSYRIPKADVDAFLAANSTGPHLRSALFQKVLQIADQNPGVDSDHVLEELEEYDQEQKARRAHAAPA